MLEVVLAGVGVAALIWCVGGAVLVGMKYGTPCGVKYCWKVAIPVARMFWLLVMFGYLVQVTVVCPGCLHLKHSFCAMHLALSSGVSFGGLASAVPVFEFVFPAVVFFLNLLKRCERGLSLVVAPLRALRRL